MKSPVFEALIGKIFADWRDAENVHCLPDHARR